MNFSLNKLDSTNDVSNASLNNTSLSPFSVASQSQVLTWTIVTLFVCAIGCLNNCMVLYATWPRNGDKSGVNLLIFHFIVANLFNCLIHYPIRCIMVQAKQAGYLASVLVCDFVQPFLDVNWSVVYWSDAGLAINRCVALFLPYIYHSYSSKVCNIVQIAVMWLLSAAVYYPNDFGVGSYLTIIPMGHCAYRAINVNPRSPYTGFVSVYRYLPFAITGLGSLLILCKCYVMSRKNTTLQTLRDGNIAAATRLHQRMLLAKILVVNFIWSVMCNAPSSVILGSFPFVFARDPMANSWLQTFAVIQYAFSACIFLIANPKYRDRLRQIGPPRHVVPFDNSFSLTMRGHVLNASRS